MCHFLVLQMAKELECKATEAISPTAPESPRTDQSLGGSASSVRSRTALFVFSVTCNIWLPLLAVVQR